MIAVSGGQHGKLTCVRGVHHRLAGKARSRSDGLRWSAGEYRWAGRYSSAKRHNAGRHTRLRPRAAV